MDEMREFAKSIDEALRWLQQGEGELINLYEDCERQFPEVGVSLSRFSDAYTALKALREPLEQHIKAAEVQHAKEETLYGE